MCRSLCAEGTLRVGDLTALFCTGAVIDCHFHHLALWGNVAPLQRQQLHKQSMEFELVYYMDLRL